MRELRNCDFCDGNALGAFEIVPPELNPDEAEQRRVVLCESCQSTLSELIEPLLARAGAAPSGGSEQPTGGRPGDTRTGGEDAASDGAITIGGTEASEPEASDETVRDETVNGNRTGAGGAHTDSSQARKRSGSGAQTQPGDTGVTTDSNAAEAGGSTASTATETQATGNTGITRQSSAPPAYRKVLRLLRNRELPMARTDVETLASGAYDLEDDEVEAVLDHAIAEGDLVEDGRQIRLG